MTATIGHPEEDFYDADAHIQAIEVPKIKIGGLVHKGRVLSAEQVAPYFARLDSLNGHYLREMTPEALAKMLRQIVPVEMEIDKVDSTFKLNQNRSDAARLGAAAGLAAGGTPGMETTALAALMRGVGDG